MNPRRFKRLCKPGAYSSSAALEIDIDLNRHNSLSLELGPWSENVYFILEIRVRADFSSGVRSRVNGIPTFFINETRHDGPFDYESLVLALGEKSGKPGNPLVVRCSQARNPLQSAA